MGSKITLLLILLSATLNAQYFQHLKRQVAPVSLWYVSGLFDGAADMMRDKYSVSVFPQDNELLLGRSRQFWNPYESWTNKYRNWPTDTRAAWPGAKTWSVSLSDGWHLSKTLHLKAAQAASVMYQPPIEYNWLPSYEGQEPPTRIKPKWWWKLADAAIMSLSFSAGWHTSELLLIRR